MDSTSSFSKLQSTLGSTDSAFNLAEALGENTALTTVAPSLLAPRASLLFIDSTVADYQSLIAGATAGTEVHLLSSAQDAISQITNTLLGREGISSIHIVSHGQAGGLNFANGLFNLSSLPEYATQIQSWSQALTDDADILLYGCNVAEGELGQAFVQILSQLSGADVAASNDLTGTAVKGGNWTLEYQTGKIESPYGFESSTMRTYDSVLSALFDSLTGPQTIENRAAEFNIGLHIRADQTVIVNTISILGDLSQSGNLKFVIFDAVTTSRLYVSSAKFFVDNGMSWKQSDPFSFTLQAGKTYDIGVVADVSGDWVWDRTQETQNGLTSLVSNPNFSNFADPQDINGHAGVDAAIRLNDVTNAAPSVSLPSGAIAYTENAAATVLDTSATISDLDSANFDTGTLTVSFSANGTVDDRLIINNQGTGVGQIGVSSSNITYGGTTIGTFTGGVGTTPLVITFNANSSPAAAQALLRNLGYSNVSDTPSTTARTISVVLTDGDGGTSSTVTKTVNITAVDDPSVLAVSGNLNFTEDGSAIVVAPGLTISDPDGMNGARVSIANPGVGDALGVQGQSGTNGTISGINWSYDATTGILTFSGTASAATYESVLRQVTYSNSSQAPTPGDRNIQFSLGSVLSNPGNNHFYEFVSAPNISWTAAQTAAANRRLFGLQGYLATVTSANEQAFVESKLNGQGWMGASDAATEGDWRWVTGPEGLANGGTGTPFWLGLGIGGAPVGGQYNNWDEGEPNNAGDEDYAHFLDNGQWNDYPLSLSSITGYVVEYGGMPGDPSLQTTGNVTITVAGVNDPSTGNITIPTAVQEGQQVTADISGFSDPDGIVSFSYQWQQSTDGVTWTNITGATNVNFTPGNAQVGQRLRVQVSYTDGGGTAEGPILSNSTTSGVVNVNNSPTGNVVISGTVQEDQQLTADTSGLNDADGLGAFSYQWQQSTDGVNWTSITGATNVNFTPGDAQVGQRLRVQVSYTDGDGTPEGPISSTATTSAVSNINDALTGTVTISGTVQEDQQLTADTSGLTDGDGIGTFSYQWQQSTDGVNWTTITGATNVNFTPGDAQVGQQLRVQVSHTDARGTTEGPISSSATSLTTGINDAPTLNAPANITVTENTPTAITGITFNDVDAGTGTLTATFTIPAGTLAGISANGVTVGGTATNLTLSGTLAAINAFITAGSLKYTTATNSLTAQTLNVTINDNGTGGTGGSLTATTTINLPVNPQPPAVSISNVSHSEGTRGNKTYTFTVALSKASNQPITIGYATADGTAKVSDNDYVTANGNITFNPGDPLTKTFTVTVNGDSKLEATENFQIGLSLVSGTATIANSTALGFIGDDDGNGIDINMDGIVDSFWRNSSASVSGIWFMNGTSLASTAALPSVSSDWRMEETGDFNDDGIDDFFWHNTRTGQTGMWLMNQAGGIASIVSSLTVSADWRLEHVGDFDGDNQVDMLWRNASSGDNGIWLMNGTTFRTSVALLKADSSWEISAVGDFDGDQDLDILWRNTVTGTNGIWNLNNASFSSATALAAAAPGWTVADVADLDADGDLDILWHNTNTADVGIWRMNNGTVEPGGYLAIPRIMGDPNWRIQGIIDVEGDGKLEIFWRHLTLGVNGIWRMNGVEYSGNAAVPAADPSWSTYVEG